MSVESSHYPALTEHPHRGQWLSCGFSGARVSVLWQRLQQLELELGADHPHAALTRSWYVVAHGSEAFDERLLAAARKSEPVLRECFPPARRALALNLAVQGLHTWFLETKQAAIKPLEQAFDMMVREDLVTAVDVVKVAEVLADCLASVARYDEAVSVLFDAQPYLLNAAEQDAWVCAQLDEVREQIVSAHGDACSEDLQYMVALLDGPRNRDMLPSNEAWVIRI